jgi:glycosyltransferase involved in cell wall biosynthesis
VTRAPEFSVVIPARAPAPTLTKALASAAAQTLAPIEVIVVDNGLSPHERPSVANVRMIQGRGASAGAARNDGVLAARGEWVAFLDSDDLWKPGHLAAVGAIVSQRPEVATCFGGAVHVSDEGQVMAVFRPREHHATLRGLLTRRLQPTTSATAARRDALLEVGGFFEGFKVGVEDVDLWWRLAARWPCAVQAEPLVTYVVHVERDQARTAEELTLLSRDRRIGIQRIREQTRGPLGRHAAAQYLAIMARYWYIAGFGSRGRREAVESLFWWPTMNGALSLGLGLIPGGLRERARAAPRALRRARR